MRRRGHRTYKICANCGAGFDAFKAMEARGRYCSPGCLAEARQRHSRPAVEVAPAVSGADIIMGMTPDAGVA